MQDDEGREVALKIDRLDSKKCTPETATKSYIEVYIYIYSCSVCVCVGVCVMYVCIYRYVRRCHYYTSYVILT